MQISKLFKMSFIIAVKDVRPTSWCNLSFEIPLIVLVLANAALYWTDSFFADIIGLILNYIP